MKHSDASARWEKDAMRAFRQRLNASQRAAVDARALAYCAPRYGPMLKLATAIKVREDSLVLTPEK